MMPALSLPNRRLLTACPTVNLNHFRLLRVVGKGAFGKVRIVEEKHSGLTFALKYIRKDEGQKYTPETRPATRAAEHPPASLQC
jgi:serine/threonine kinase 32